MIGELTLSSCVISELPQLLSRANKCVGGLGRDYAVFSKQLAELHQRLEQGRFHLAVLGQFKRGKSTLLNSLWGEAVLPTAVVPLTAIPTFIRHGRLPRAIVRYHDERKATEFTPTLTETLNSFLNRYVTEDANPKNGLGIVFVEVEHPAPILEKGVVLIDTPGIGSTFHHNTETALNFLPQCDAALFLVSADPPLTEVEVEFLRQVRAKVPRLFFILNKVDYLSPEEREISLKFLKKVLVEQVGIPPDTPVFCVSARQALESRLSNHSHLWQQSGLDQVERHLVEFLANEKMQTLGNAVRRKTADVIADVLMQLHLAIQSHQMPLEKLQQCLGIFEKKIKEIQQQRQSAADLLSGDRKRMHEALENHSEQLRAEARQYLEGSVKEALARKGGLEINEGLIRDILLDTIPGYFEHQLGSTTEQFRRRMAEVLRPHQVRADQIIETLRRAASELFDIPYHAPESDKAFEIIRQPYWVTHQWSSTLSPIPKGLLNGFLPTETRRKSVLKRVNAEIHALVLSNVENLRWAIYQSIDQTFNKFGSTLDQRLADTLTATYGAISAAMDRRQKQSSEAEEEISHWKTALTELNALQGWLSKE